MNAYLYHFIYEFRTGIRDRSLMLFNYLFPLLFLALAGTLMSGINPDFKGYMIPAMSLFAVMSCFLLGLPSSIVSLRETGVLRSYRINGVPGWTSMVMPVFANLIHMAAVTGIIIVFSSLVLSAELPQNAGIFVFGWLISAMAMAGLGTLVAVVSNSSRASILIAQAIYIPSILLGGLMTPPDILPAGLDRVALIWPATQAMRVFRQVDGWWISAVVLAVGAVLAFLCSGLLYEWDPKNQRPARYKLIAIAALLPYLVMAAVGTG